MSSLTIGERVINRARSLMSNGKARSWSHAIQVAAESLEEAPPPADRPKPAQRRQKAQEQPE